METNCSKMPAITTSGFQLTSGVLELFQAMPGLPKMNLLDYEACFY